MSYPASIAFFRAAVICLSILTVLPEALSAAPRLLFTGTEEDPSEATPDFRINSLDLSDPDNPIPRILYDGAPAGSQGEKINPETIAYDPVTRRVFFSWLSDTSSGISYFHIDDPEVLNTPAGESIQTVFTETDLPLFEKPSCLLIDGVLNQIFWSQEGPGTASSILRFDLNTGTASTLLSFNYTLDQKKIKCITFYPDENNLKQNLIVSIEISDQSGTGDIIKLSPDSGLTQKMKGSISAPDSLYYDQKTSSLFSLNYTNARQERYLVTKDVLLKKISNLYNLSPTDLIGFTVLPDPELNVIVTNKESGQVSFYRSDAEIFQPSLLWSQSFNSAHIAAAPSCQQDAAIDRDGDSIPDCADNCPLDPDDSCSDLILVHEESSVFLRQSELKETPPLYATGYAGFPDKLVVDELRNLYIWTEGRDLVITTPEQNQHTRHSDIIPEGTQIKALDYDPEYHLLYIGVATPSGTAIFSIDYLELAPAARAVWSSNGFFLTDLIIDPRHDSSIEKAIYLSDSNGVSRLGLESLQFSRFFSLQYRTVDQIALDYNENRLYIFSRDSKNGRLDSVHILRGKHSQSFASDTRTSRAIAMQYQPLSGREKNGKKGRIYIAFSDPYDGIPLRLLDVQEANPLITPVDFSFPDKPLADFSIRSACSSSLSLDINLDGISECFVASGGDECPSDPLKVTAGVCGCGYPDTDSDRDGVADCIDSCPQNGNLRTPGVCGCDPETDTDSDGTPDCIDLCPANYAKHTPGICGCARPDTDSDGDGTPDCIDLCPFDSRKQISGICGCNAPETDSDSDGIPDCIDACPLNPERRVADFCECNEEAIASDDADSDNSPDCIDVCPDDPEHGSTPPVCGCNVEQDTADDDGDGIINCLENCNGSIPERCGCGIVDCPKGSVFDPILTQFSRLSLSPSIEAEKKNSVNIFLKRFASALIIEVGPTAFAKKSSAKKGEKKNGKKDSKKPGEKRRKKNKRSGKLEVRYEVILKRLKQRKRFIVNKITKNNILRMDGLKRGKYVVRYRALIKSKKKTVSKTNFSPATSFRIPLL